MKSEFCENFATNLRQVLGKFEFHHLGIATKNIEKEFKSYALLGYEREDFFAKDEIQGVKGLFLRAKNQPRIELLENLEGSTTLDYFLRKGIKIYHFAYVVGDIDRAFEIFTSKLGGGAKVVSQMQFSAYFKTRICFLMLPNMWMIELIESNLQERKENG